MCDKYILKPKGFCQRKGGANEFKTLCMETILVKCLTGLLRKNLNVRNNTILKMGIVCNRFKWPWVRVPALHLLAEGIWIGSLNSLFKIFISIFN